MMLIGVVDHTDARLIPLLGFARRSAISFVLLVGRGLRARW